MTIDSWCWAAVLVPLVGHVLYGVPAAAGVRRVRLHNGDAFDDRDGPPSPERLASLRVVGAAGTQTAVAARDADGAVDVEVPGSGPAWLVVETPPAFIELPSAKFDAYLAHEGLTPVLDARRVGAAGAPGREIYSKHIKVAIGDAAAEALGLPVEMVPAAGGFHRGRVLRVRLLVDGVPAAGVQVAVGHRDGSAGPASDDRTRRTDLDGWTSLAIDRSGVWRLHAIVMTPYDRPTEADWRSRWAGLTFRA